MRYFDAYPTELPVALLDILPNPVMVKDDNLKYVWANRAFLDLFSVGLERLIGELDIDVFPHRQASQCNGGDLRVLATGDVDEAVETVFPDGSDPRETLTRKSRLVLSDGSQLLVGVMHDVTDVVKANRELEAATELLEKQNVELDELANTDVLTGCLNRRAFLSHASDVIKGSSVGLLIGDIDYFKRINDSFGHSAGDAALQHFVAIAGTQIRDADKIARIGGEEFAFLMPGMDVDNLKVFGERIRSAIEQAPLLFNGKQIDMTVSLGGALSEAPLTDLELLMSRADSCLYSAKDKGRNHLVVDA